METLADLPAEMKVELVFTYDGTGNLTAMVWADIAGYLFFLLANGT
jgi:hypothetical protein